jgi:hypothetical protein
VIAKKPNNIDQGTRGSVIKLTGSDTNDNEPIEYNKYGNTAR